MEGRFPEWMLKDLRTALANECVFGLCRSLNFSKYVFFYFLSSDFRIDVFLFCSQPPNHLLNIKTRIVFV